MASSGRRLRIDDMVGDRLGWDRLRGPDPSYRLEGATLTFEPGGQIEVSTDPVPSISGAIDLALTSLEKVAAAIPGRAVFAGLDLWNGVSTVPLQLRAPRYTAMDTYFGGLSSVGRVMMRHTCAVQLNLDGGAACSAGGSEWPKPSPPF